MECQAIPHVSQFCGRSTDLNSKTIMHVHLYVPLTEIEAPFLLDGCGPASFPRVRWWSNYLLTISHVREPTHHRSWKALYFYTARVSRNRVQRKWSWYHKCKSLMRTRWPRTGARAKPPVRGGAGFGCSWSPSLLAVTKVTGNIQKIVERNFYFFLLSKYDNTVSSVRLHTKPID